MSVDQKSKRERGYDSGKGFKRGFRNKMKKDGAFDGRFRSKVEDDKKKKKVTKGCRSWDWKKELELLEELEDDEELEDIE